MAGAASIKAVMLAVRWVAHARGYSDRMKALVSLSALACLFSSRCLFVATRCPL